MDASNRDVRAVAACARPRLESTTSPRAAAVQADGLAGPPLAGLRVALVHDWLTGMRGGEKCLEVLCRAFPDATLYTLDPSAGLAQPGDRVDGDPDLTAPDGSRGLPPLSAPAADHADGCACLEAQRCGPRDQPEPLRGQGDPCRRQGSPMSAIASPR